MIFSLFVLLKFLCENILISLQNRFNPKSSLYKNNYKRRQNSKSSDMLCSYLEYSHSMLTNYFLSQTQHLNTFEFGEKRLVKERGDRFGIIGDILSRKR